MATPEEHPPTLQLATELQEELRAVTETGLYESEEAVVEDAFRTLLAARPDLRTAVACRLYEKDVFSLGKAAEWGRLSIEAMKRELAERRIERRMLEDPMTIDEMAERAASLARRS